MRTHYRWIIPYERQEELETPISKPAATVDFFSENISWDVTNDPFYPFEAHVETMELRLRLNDDRHTQKYLLVINDEFICCFDDWPKSWKR